MKKIFAAILLSTCLATSSSPLLKILRTLGSCAQVNRASFGVKVRRNMKRHQKPLASIAAIVGATTTSTALALQAQNAKPIKPFSKDEELQRLVASLSSGL